MVRGAFLGELSFSVLISIFPNNSDFAAFAYDCHKFSDSDGLDLSFSLSCSITASGRSFQADSGVDNAGSAVSAI